VVVEGLKSKTEISISNLQGQLLFSGDTGNNPAIQLDLTAFPAGVYMLRISDEKNTMVKKLIKE
jgi:hypothetical protein